MIKCGKEKASPIVNKKCEWCKKDFSISDHKYFIKKCCTKECSNMLNKIREVKKWKTHIKVEKPKMSRSKMSRSNNWRQGMALTEIDEANRKNKNSAAAKLNLHGNYGGYKNGSGRGKKGWYKGFYCQSSWELAWVIYSLEHGIKFDRNTEGFEYEFENKKHKYYPDFIIGNKSYVEIKGYSSKQWEAKQSQFPHQIDVIDKNGIKLYIEYAKSIHGKDFIKLLESKATGSSR